MGSRQPPEKTFRVGNISASVFTTEIPPKGDNGTSRTLRNVTLQRSYIDDHGRRQYASRFSLSDLPSALEVLTIAKDCVAGLEADVSA